MKSNDFNMEENHMKIQKNRKIEASSGEKDLGISHLPLCREPWESFYILRRGILPCCHGSQPIAPMSEWAAAWNSPQLQEIRSYLSHGKLSPYCLDSLSCPIVQKYLSKQKKHTLFASFYPQQRAPSLRLLNRLLFRIPGKFYRALIRWREKRTI